MGHLYKQITNYKFSCNPSVSLWDWVTEKNEMMSVTCGRMFPKFSGLSSSVAPAKTVVHCYTIKSKRIRKIFWEMFDHIVENSGNQNSLVNVCVPQKKKSHTKLWHNLLFWVNCPFKATTLITLEIAFKEPKWAFMLCIEDMYYIVVHFNIFLMVCRFCIILNVYYRASYRFLATYGLMFSNIWLEGMWTYVVSSFWTPLWDL